MSFSSISCGQKLNPYQIHFNNEKEKRCSAPITLETTPKSGTHLLIKILNLLDIDHIVDWKHLTSKSNQISRGNSFSTVFKKNKKFFVLFRDPRDLIISQIFWSKSLKSKENLLGDKEYMSLSMNELIDRYITQNLFTRVNKRSTGLFKSLQLALRIKQKKEQNQLNNICLLRFEDLIPSKAGGSSEEVRFKTFMKICKFAEINISNQRVREVMSSSWGEKGGTFRKDEPKKVGQWKKYFSPEQASLFKERYNSLILGLGYETDPNWDEKHIDSFFPKKNADAAEAT